MGTRGLGKGLGLSSHFPWALGPTSPTLSSPQVRVGAGALGGQPGKAGPGKPSPTQPAVREVRPRGLACLLALRLPATGPVPVLPRGDTWVCGGTGGCLQPERLCLNTKVPSGPAVAGKKKGCSVPWAGCGVALGLGQASVH